MGFKLPWSNFHELNLDWLLEKMKELEEKVDSFIGSAVPSNDPPEMDGVASVGSSVNYARGDHVHPTDTSRASQTYAQSIEGKVDDLDHNCDINFREIYDILNFSTAAPLVDGVANPGNSQYPARADHVHPTDTSRASQTQVDTLQAVVDSWQGSAAPYGLTPVMDGAGSAGTVDSYARGDHQHPSDSAKLDKTGGTINGDLTITGFLYAKAHTVFHFTDATGWLRIARVPVYKGTMIRIGIGRCGTEDEDYSETHEIILDIRKSVYAFKYEMSDGDTLYIDKIRLSDAGYVDVHVDNVAASNLGFAMLPVAPTAAQYKAIACENPPSWVGIIPDGETILAEYTFYKRTEISSSFNGGGKSWSYYTRRGAYMLVSNGTIGENVASSLVVGTLPAQYRPGATLMFPSSNNPDCYISIGTNGTVTLFTGNGLTSGDPCAFTATWIK